MKTAYIYGKKAYTGSTQRAGTRQSQMQMFLKRISGYLFFPNKGIRCIPESEMIYYFC